MISGLSNAHLRRAAYEELEGVGNAALGEWTEFTGKAFHLRRRMRPTEQLLVGPVVDIRGTPEARERLAPVAHMLPAEWPEF